MNARIVRIGNSQGVRIPKPLLEEAGLGAEVHLHAEPGRIVIEPAAKPRRGWAEAARRMHEEGEDRLLDPPTSTQFDEAEWEWR
jgi:antitoxin MazE